MPEEIEAGSDTSTLPHYRFHGARKTPDEGPETSQADRHRPGWALSWIGASVAEPSRPGNLQQDVISPLSRLVSALNSHLQHNITTERRADGRSTPIPRGAGALRQNRQPAADPYPETEGIARNLARTSINAGADGDGNGADYRDRPRPERSLAEGMLASGLTCVRAPEGFPRKTLKAILGEADPGAEVSSADQENILQIQIRLAEAADTPGIFHVRTSVRENALTRAQMAEMGITETSVSQMILDAPCAWVALAQGGIVGFSIADLAEGSLFAAFVSPSHEGKGIGRRLVQAAEEALFQRHATAWLETGGTTRAAGFYRRLGWGSERDIGEGDIRLEKQRA